LLEPAGLAIPLVLVALELVVAWSYRGAFAPMLRARVEPQSVIGQALRERSPARA
jgi:hypothetical protein